MNNEFEKDVQSKRNDFNDSVVGFVVSFGFFATIFVIGSAISVLATW
ncbi:YqzM-like protein [Salsuginibacillus halophilus]|uniref:YqzM-like protein n=1 Tax=Salsuginibacillus halophilus TaxID=517424 RepID=A0A2P8HFS5_9BACI|nr:YqzM family protein [Salsuginibacillus halophilus]PSL45044.1 YqzM-like protein [Salsuginibacillus halophilus]